MSNKRDYHERHPYPEMTMRRNATTFLCLKFAKSMNREFSYEDLHFMNPNKFPMGTGRGARTHRTDSLVKLDQLGLLKKLTNGKYKMTPEGLQYFNVVSKYYQRNPTRSELQAKQQMLHQ